MAGLIDAEPLSEGELRLGLPLEVRTDRLTVWRDLGADRLLQFVDAYRETVGGGVRVVYRIGASGWRTGSEVFSRPAVRFVFAVSAAELTAASRAGHPRFGLAVFGFAAAVQSRRTVFHRGRGIRPFRHEPNLAPLGCRNHT
jgi:hypothetical protein